MNGEKIILAAFPWEEPPRLPGTEILHLSCRAAPDGTLLRHRLAAPASGGVLGILGEFPAEADPEAAAREIAAACAAGEQTGVFLDQDRADPGAEALCAALAPRLRAAGRGLYVRPALARADAVVFFSSQVTGGSFARYLEELVRDFPDNAGLELTPLAVSIPLPGDGRGQPLDRDALAALPDRRSEGWLSPELAARYLTCTDEDGGTRLLLWDDGGTLAEKLRLARAAGIRRFLLPVGALGERLRDLLPDA